MILNSFAGKQFYFMGIGGAGMAPLAMLFHQKGGIVSGSDIKDNYNINMLKEHGVPIKIGSHSTQNLPSGEFTLIHSSAVSLDNEEIIASQNKNMPILRRGEALALFAESFKRSVAISGSHGKTTVTSLIVHMLKCCNMNPGYMIGGRVRGWDSLASIGSGNDIFITEVDESDGTHTAISPYIGGVINIEDDHAWSVGGKQQLFKNFKQFATQSKQLFFIAEGRDVPILYGIENGINLGSTPQFETLTEKELESWGHYQQINGYLAVEICVALGTGRPEAERALLSFPGVDRRMVEHINSEAFVFIEDYAHHPTEVNAVLTTLKTRFSEYKMVVVFQPHRYARLEQYLHEFANELKIADTVLITPVFVAWVHDAKIESEDLASLIGEKATVLRDGWEAMSEKIYTYKDDKKTLFVLLGAGDINQLIPLLNKKLKGR